MKKSSFYKTLVMITTLFFLSHVYSQNSNTGYPSNSIGSQVPKQSKYPAARMTKDFLVAVPADQPVADKYQLDVSGLYFITTDKEEKFFSGMNTEYVTFDYDKSDNIVWVNPDRKKIAEAKWTTADFNSYLATLATDMKTRYEALDQ